MQPERTSHPKRVAAIFIRDLEGEIMVKLIKADFDGQVMQFNAESWMNSTVAAKAFGKDLSNWIRSADVDEYICELKSVHSTDLDLIKTKRGNNGGTWIHPDLVVLFARWCNVRFAVWCDRQIKAILSGDNGSAAREVASLEFKSMCAHLQSRREIDGKETKHFHYANEAKLVNFAFHGKFEPIDRGLLSDSDLRILASLEIKNSALIGCGVDRETRKEILCQMVSAARLKLLK